MLVTGWKDRLPKVGRSPETRRFMFAGLAALRLLAAGCTACSLISLGATPALAESRDELREFDIPEQDLASALEIFAQQAGVQILFPYDAAADKSSRALKGRYSNRRAIARLLAGQGLYVARFSGQRITLRRLPPGSTARAASRRREAPARSAQSPAMARRPLPPAPPEDIVVTGRALSVLMDRSEYSYAISTFGREALDRESPVSTADLFRRVPGFWVESSGGEAGNNVRSRGIPTDGFSAIAVAENGLPAQYDGALGYLNTDQSFRIDDTIARVEAVRGGPSSLFMPNAPGGVFNFITRSGLDEQGGRIRATLGDRGYARIDGHVTARLSDELGLLAGGFYRRDGGRRDPGYTADEGGQFRIGLDYRDGGTTVSLDLRHLSDRVTFYLPVPLQSGPDGKPEAIAGFDPLRDSLSGPETLSVELSNGGAPARFDLTRGTDTSLTALTVRATVELGEHAHWQGGLRWRTSDTIRNALFPTGTPMTGADYLASIREQTLGAFPASAGLQLRYAGSGSAFPDTANGNGLVTGANLLSVSVPLDEVVVDQRLNWRVKAAGRHDMAVGMTAARYSYDFDRYMGTVLLEVADEARLLDAVALSADGTIVGAYTDNGVQRYGSIFDRVAMSADALAFYVADEWRLSGDLRFDLAARWESNAFTGSAMRQTTIDLGDPATLADDQVLGPGGTAIAIDHDFEGFGWSLGANYQAAPGFGLFARYTSTFRLPSASEFNTAPTRTDQARIPINMAEFGIRFAGERVSLFATAFYSRFERLPFTDFRFDTQSNAYVEQTEIAGTRTTGMEIEAEWRPGRAFDLALQATWQAPEYRDFAFTRIEDGQPVLHDYSGRQLIRVPRLSLRASPAVTLFDGRLRLELTAEHFSQRYADIANRQVLPAYTMLGLHGQARLNRTVSLGLHATNLANTLGLTEGNPRTGAFTGPAIDTYFFARPEFGRMVRMDLAAEF